jgi:transposase-like protein
MASTYGVDDAVFIQPRRCRTVAEKLRLIRETYVPGVSIGAVARGNGLDHHLLRRWRRLAVRGVLDEAKADRRCERCSQPFEAARPEARFCSSKCRQSAYRRHKSLRLQCS